MRNCFFLIFIYHFASAFTCVYAQPLLRELPPGELSIEEIGVAQGLSQGMIHGLDVDLKGYLWIATKDGLNRYDGHHFHVFRHDPQDKESIASNYIRSLHIDDRGLIWVGTIASGLELYNPTTSSFIHFGKELNPRSQSNIRSVTRIFSDAAGRVLIWDGAGENAEMLITVPGKDPYHVESWQIKPLAEIYPHLPEIPSPYAQSMTGFDKDGALLFTYQNTLFRLYPDRSERWQPGNVFIPENEFPYLGPHFFLDERRHLYCLNPKEELLYSWNEEKKEFVPSIRLPFDFLYKASRHFVDATGRIWSNSNWVPMSRINPEEGTYQEFEVKRYHVGGTENTAYAIFCEDQHHNLWAGTAGNGIIKISSRNDQFTRLSATAKKQLGFKVAQDGFSFKVHDRFTFAHDLKLKEQLDKVDLMVGSSYVQDPEGYLWCAAAGHSTSTNHLMKIKVDDLSYSLSPLKICNLNPVGNEAVLMVDRAGDLWIGTDCTDEKARLIRLHHPDTAQDAFIFPVEVIMSEHQFISDWYVDEQNIFWLGTKQGLFQFNPATTEWKHWINNPSTTNTLSHNHILSICPDPTIPKKYLWIGTDGGGLNKMNVEEGTFQRFSTDNGLPNNVIYAVQSDSHHQLWLSTNRGLCLFSTDSGVVRTFTLHDGLQSNEFNRLEYGKASDGKLYFGSMEGPVFFDPEVFYTTPSTSPIVINRLRLSNKEVTYTHGLGKMGKKIYMLPAPLENCKQLTFPYSERMITLGFSMLDFTNPNGNKYRYKLEGFNEDWIDAEAENEAVFTNLSPGKYTFLVSGCNSKNAWSAPAQLQLTILPPWWGTWWFRAFVLIAIASGIYAFYQYRLRQALKLQHIRNRIAADLHDEIGSTLSSISLAGTVIQHKLKSNDKDVNQLLNKINDNTQSMMEAMSDIVWAVNTKNDRFDHVLHRMRAFAAEILEPKEVMVQFDVSPNASQLQLDMQQRKNLYLVFKEVINNAAKYAECQNVWITIHYGNGRMTMEIKDDGVGFDAQPIKESVLNETNSSRHRMGGNGIANMHQRASELKGKLDINSSPGHGTKVCLTFDV